MSVGNVRGVVAYNGHYLVEASQDSSRVSSSVSHMSFSFFDLYRFSILYSSVHVVMDDLTSSPSLPSNCIIRAESIVCHQVAIFCSVLERKVGTRHLLDGN